MVNTKGYRRGTRYMFAKDFRKRGVEHLSTYLRVYKRGDFVDIKGNGAFQGGMPHKSYHGRTGRVFNVSHRALGVIVNKRVRARIIPKRIYVRIEHVKPSNCRKDFLERVKKNDILRQESKKAGKKVIIKREVGQPRKQHVVRAKHEIQLVTPIPYEFMA
ncbi:60S ribosomal protein L21-like [Varroa jacobsoni]|uniref:Large ribosomal subunit protein eL21 n=1 Tax=Varroa destructor TaxID=109461 RepID=A0A7M7KWS0_VARDE|nr:60S ribosomal protein L21-like [Varroa destructor]XP_022673183.1 60S ribosomal protein L21-like [Varroa destructor]XP_022701306.1 60S ribosomal protein L21-like [Varroa jacobsoni]XP_022701314.1 60S ribosomal protein L21-like [Varroa jacobsoni]